MSELAVSVSFPCRFATVVSKSVPFKAIESKWPVLNPDSFPICLYHYLRFNVGRFDQIKLKHKHCLVWLLLPTVDGVKVCRAVWNDGAFVVSQSKLEPPVWYARQLNNWVCNIFDVTVAVVNHMYGIRCVVFAIAAVCEEP